MKFLGFIFTIALSTTVIADQPCDVVSAKPAINTKCVTSKNIQFTRLDGAWRDEVSKTIWYDSSPGDDVNQFEASQYCASQGWQLPTGYRQDQNGQYKFPQTDSDFVVGEKHGLREVVKDLNGKRLWSASSMHPILNESAYYFYGGELFYFHTRPKEYNSNAQFTARCVLKTQPDVFNRGDVLINKKGKVIFTEDQNHAQELCAQRGQRLPTAREFAQLATTHGAKGILEVNEVKNKFKGIAPKGYKLIKSKGDNFYYSNEGYQKPDDIVECNDCLWTSSENPQPYAPYKVIHYSYSGIFTDDILYAGNKWIACAVKCVK